ncbi:hypothetical protein ACFLXA_04075 [Chloroflexota bacterium]
MEPIDLDPRYSTNEIPGKCIKCLGEQELNKCLMQLISTGDQTSDDVQNKYEALVTFLQSPDSQKLRAESERYLSEGKEVTVKIEFIDGKPKYELIVEE